MSRNFHSRPACARLMCRAIGRTLQRLRPAEEEVAGTGITDRPTAVIAGQFEQRATLRERNVRVETGVVDIRLGFDHPDRRQPLLAQRDAADEKCNHPLRDATFVSSTPLAVRPGIGGEPSNPEPMDFSHHRAVTDAAAQFLGDLPRRDALRPPLRHIGDSLIRPGGCCCTSTQCSLGIPSARPCGFPSTTIWERIYITTFRMQLSTTKCSCGAATVTI